MIAVWCQSKRRLKATLRDKYKIFILLTVFTLFISISSISAADITSVGIDTADSSANDLNIDTFDVYPINQDNALGAWAVEETTKDNALGALGTGILTQDNALGAWAMGPVTQDNASILN